MGPMQILKPCAFPFIYENVRYEHCTTVNSDFAWCSVDSIFNGKWRYCVSTDPPACKFPFLFGKKLYHACTTDGYVLGKTWCALTHNYNMNGLWKPCSPNGEGATGVGAL
ncbi:binder of sperm protein homolog 2-like isoform X5 [Vombatus ursinus]|uniref:binder of sperm protein homolog 2-like isoform X5 n=1 Tax=Vombatus ursinus TaxID=29139 RepID=UPI000FFDA8F5|nr:binder of sperm protein homolog 2-like isoform X5 [Vombatus ursinus]